MMSEVKAIQCDRCNYTNHDTAEFRQFVGNVGVPGEGGLIGNNIWLSAQDVPSKKTIAAESAESDLLITYTDLCIPCLLEVMGISSIGENCLK